MVENGEENGVSGAEMDLNEFVHLKANELKAPLKEKKETRPEKFDRTFTECGFNPEDKYIFREGIVALMYMNGFNLQRATAISVEPDVHIICKTLRNIWPDLDVSNVWLFEVIREAMADPESIKQSKEWLAESRVISNQIEENYGLGSIDKPDSLDGS